MAFHQWLHPSPDQLASHEDLTLADLRVNDHAQVREMCCGKLATNRLVSLGFTPGADVAMTQNYGYGPLIVTVRGGQVALGRGEAVHIRVERLDT